MHEEQKVMEGRYNLPYNWLYKASGRHWRGKNGLWTIASKLAGPLLGKSVLDAGCGDGWYSARMIKVGAKVSGIDLSERAPKFAAQILSEGDFRTGSLTALPYAKGEFDAVFSFQVLEHLPADELSKGVAELARVLRKDGRLIVSVPSVNRPLSKAHFRHFTAKTITEVLEPHFTVEKIVGQERKGLTLSFIERLLENRIWILPEFAERFHRGLYLRNFNTTSPTAGANLVVLAKPRIQP